MINFLFHWDSWFSTDLSQPPWGLWRVDAPGHIILPKSAASPGPSFLPGSLSSGSWVPFHRPGLGLLSWPRWWVAMTSGSSSVSATGSISSPRPPFQALLDHSVCLSTCCIFSDSSVLGSALVLQRPLSWSTGRALSSLLVTLANMCSWHVLWTAGHGCPPLLPAPPPSRELLGQGWPTAV